MNGSDSPSVSTHFARGRLLQQQHRYEDAVQSYRQALELDPEHAPSYVMLALCWLGKDDTAGRALDAAQRAVALEPENAFARSVMALAMNACAQNGQTAQVREALKEAQAAAGLDPDNDFCHAVQASLHMRLHEYPLAEMAARQALELDPENTMAASVLSAALLMQKKDGDNKSLIDYQLQRNPDDDDAHTSAGWQALMEGDHKRANQHFLEALRLSPMSEGARMGLVESYRARSAFYRLQLRFAHFMNQFTEGRQTAILVGGFVAYKVVSVLLKDVSPVLSSVVIGLWLVFALWSHLARGLSTFFITLDKFARQALRPRECWEGVVVGGLIFGSLAVFILAYMLGIEGGGHAALVLLLAAVINSAAFTNDHHIGRHIYNVAALVGGFGAVYFAVSFFGGWELPAAYVLGVVTVMLGVAVTWLRPWRILYA